MNVGLTGQHSASGASHLGELLLQTIIMPLLLVLEVYDINLYDVDLYRGCS